MNKLSLTSIKRLEKFGEIRKETMNNRLKNMKKTHAYKKLIDNWKPRYQIIEGREEIGQKL